MVDLCSLLRLFGSCESVVRVKRALYPQLYQELKITGVLHLSPTWCTNRYLTVNFVSRLTTSRSVLCFLLPFIHLLCRPMSFKDQVRKAITIHTALIKAAFRILCFKIVLTELKKKIVLLGFKPFIEMSVIYHKVPKEGVHHIKWAASTIFNFWKKCFKKWVNEPM